MSNTVYVYGYWAGSIPIPIAIDHNIPSVISCRPIPRDNWIRVYSGSNNINIGAEAMQINAQHGVSTSPNLTTRDPTYAFEEDFVPTLII